MKVLFRHLLSRNYLRMRLEFCFHINSQPILIMSFHKPRHEEIAELARQLWERAGQPIGRDLEFWLRAETQLAPAVAKPAGATASPPLPGREGRPLQNGGRAKEKAKSGNLRPA